jgi:ArsR family transcriptional regulator, arsenate/arsenite/antimonite-responsive transcriptional repressor
VSAARASTTRASDPQTSPSAINAEFFIALGHPVRVRVLELLRTHGEMSARDIQAALQVESGRASQHLSVLRRQRVLATRHQGRSAFYRLRDPRTHRLLEVARLLLSSHFRHTQTLLDDLNDAGPTRPMTPSPSAAS